MQNIGRFVTESSVIDQINTCKCKKKTPKTLEDYRQSWAVIHVINTLNKWNNASKLLWNFSELTCLFSKMVFVSTKRFFTAIFSGLMFLSMTNFTISLMSMSTSEGNLVLSSCSLAMTSKPDSTGFPATEISVGPLTERVWLSSWDFSILSNSRESSDWNISRGGKKQTISYFSEKFSKVLWITI